MSPTRLRTLSLPFALAALITCGTAALRAQSEQEQTTDSEKKAEMGGNGGKWGQG